MFSVLRQRRWMVLIFLPILSGCSRQVDTVAPTPAQLWRHACQDFAGGRWEQAESAFQRLKSDIDWSELADLGIAEVQARRLLAAEIPSQAQAENAVNRYRDLLDRPNLKWASRDDLVHNLEVLKRFAFAPAPGTEKQSPISDPESTQQAEESSQTAGPKPSPGSTKKDGTPSVLTQDDVGVVLNPAPGLDLADPGELSPENAKTRLETSLARIREQNAKRPPRPRRPFRPGDY